MALDHLDSRPKDEQKVWDEILAHGTPDQIQKMLINKIFLDLNIKGIPKDRLRWVYNNPKLVLPEIEAVLRGGGHR